MAGYVSVGGENHTQSCRSVSEQCHPKCISSSQDQHQHAEEKTRSMWTGRSFGEQERADAASGGERRTHIPIVTQIRARVSTRHFYFEGKKGTHCVSMPKVFLPAYGISSVPSRMRSQTCKGARKHTRISLLKQQILENIHFIFETETHSVAQGGLVLPYPCLSILTTGMVDMQWYTLLR